MMYFHSVQRQASARRRPWMILGVWFLAWALFLPSQIQAQAPVPPAARELSHAFTSAARQALPAVVELFLNRKEPSSTAQHRHQ